MRLAAASAVTRKNTDPTEMFEQADSHPIGGRDRLKGGDVVSPLEFGCSPARRSDGRIGGAQIFGYHAAVVLCALADQAILMAIPFYAPSQIGRLARR